MSVTPQNVTIPGGWTGKLRTSESCCGVEVPAAHEEFADRLPGREEYETSSRVGGTARTLVAAADMGHRAPLRRNP